MTTTRLTVNDHDVSKGVIYVPYKGVWFADLDLVDDKPLTGRVVIRMGASELIGTVDDTANGTFGLRRRARVIGGAAGWRKEVKSKGYRSDAPALVKAARVAADLASECGETLGTFAGGKERLGAHYLRFMGPASSVLDDVARGVPWWVGYDGITHVGARTVQPTDPKSYERISFDPRAHCLVLAVDDLSAVGVGSTITKDLDSPVVISSFELEVTPESVRMTAWTGDTGAAGSKLGKSLAALVRRFESGKLEGIYRYRVVERAGDRLDLQIVRKGTGAPDALSVPMWPGAGSMHTVCALGAEVLVQFVAGDPSDPVVTGFAGRGSHGAVAKRIVLGAESGNGADAARKGDAVMVPLIPFTFTGVIGGNPATGLMTPIAPYAFGTIMTGAPGVGIGNSAGGA